MLCSILVVDDEPMQRRGLAMLIQKARPTWLVREAASGEEALECFFREPTDAVVTDIRMPGIDGLELLEQIIAASPKTVTALVSAYADFSYARRALKFGAVEYLVKPYQRETIEAMLSALERRTSDDNVSIERERIRQLQTFVSQKTPNEYAFHIESPVAALLFGDAAKPPAITIPGALCFPAPGVFGRMAALLPGARIIRDQLEAIAALQPNLTLAYAMAEEPYEAYRRACEAFTYRFYHPTGGLLCYNELRRGDMPSLYGYEQRLKYIVQNGKAASIPKEVADLLASLRKTLPPPPSILLHTVHQMMRGVMSSVENRMPNASFELLWNNCSEAFTKVHSIDELGSMLNILLSNLESTLRSNRDERASQRIQSCLRYIPEHLYMPLNLADMARKFYFSPNYLSALIKNETGLSFNQYLRKLRIDKACEVLRLTDRKVSDIAADVGFVDSAYFNRVFKQALGISPNEYRRNERQRTGG